MTNNKTINVTKCYLPDIKEYNKKLETIWKNHFLTNYGPLNKELVERLEKYLNVKNLHYTNNGTISLQLCLKALDAPGGEIITTPFTFIATSSSIVWEGYKPVFIDIDPNTYNIDPDKIEEKITDKTVAIMAVHCFGIPCDVKRIEEIAKKHNLTVIYDAAHSFGTKLDDKSVLSYGDLVSCSFHATKVFHTIEGGCVVVNDERYQKVINGMKNFGAEDGTYKYIGINSKNSEFNAAMGLCVLDDLEDIIAYRKWISDMYTEELKDVLTVPSIPENVTYNYIYYPVLFDDEKQLLKAFGELDKFDIHPRRYFYPALNDLDLFDEKGNTPIAHDISQRIACLPLDTYLEKEDVELICKTLKKSLD